ncbi:MAG: TSUP family transporter [Gammaproteobacteria bacterium]
MLFTPDNLTLELLVLLAGVACIAGFIDAIAGGGGLLVLPVLLWAGLTPAQALATNKLQAVFGSFTATLHFIRQGKINLKSMRLPIVMSFFGAACGTLLIQQFDNASLEKIIPFLLIGFAVYFLFSPRVGDLNTNPRISQNTFAFTAAFLIGFYDGFFGPGTGSFFAVAFVILLGYNLTEATAHAKLLNFVSNLAALIFFIVGGKVIWTIGLVMAIGQIIGAYFGAHMVIHHGAPLIKPFLVITSLAITLKLILF